MTFVPDIDLPPADIYIVGSGLVFPDDLTLAALAALQISNIVYALPPIDELTLGKPVVDLTLEYGGEPGLHRQQAYLSMADRIFEGAVEKPPVAFLTYGSPRLGTDLTNILENRAAALALSTYSIDAPSSLLAVASALGIEPFHGLQMWEATRFLLLRVVPLTSAPLMLFQAPYTGCQTWSRQGLPKLGPLVPDLTQYLLRIYPNEHPVHIVRTPYLRFPSKVIQVPLEHLATSLNPGLTTIVLPTLDPLEQAAEKKSHGAA